MTVTKPKNVDTVEDFKAKQPYVRERGVLVPRWQLILNPWNYNEPTESELEAIEQSLDEYGQVTEIVVRPHPTEDDTYQVIDGAHRVQTFDPNELVACNVMHGLTEAQAMHLTAVMRESRGSKANMPALGELLQKVNLELGEHTAIALPFSKEGLGSLLSLKPLTPPTDDEWDDATGKLPAGERSPFQQMTFTLHDSQKEQIDQALKLAHSLGQGDTDGLNQNSNGNALTHICEQFLEANA